MHDQCKEIKGFDINGLHIDIVTAPRTLITDHCIKSDYEFVIPISEIPINVIEKGQKSEYSPIDTAINKFLCISCDRGHIDDISNSMFGSHGHLDSESFYFGDDLHGLVEMLMVESIEKQTGFRFMQENIVNLILGIIIRRASNKPEILNSEQNHCEKRIERAVNFLKEQYNYDFNLKQVAQIADLSPYHFLRVFKAQTGRTPYKFMLEIKIEKAKELLSRGNLSITEICLLCGFNNPSHFATTFKRKTGVSPSEYRRINQINDY